MTAGLDAGSDGGLTILQCHIPAEEHEKYCRVGEGKVGEGGGGDYPCRGMPLVPVLSEPLVVIVRRSVAINLSLADTCACS